MNLWKRIKNLKALSEYDPRQIGADPVKEGTVIAQIIKKPEEKNQKAIFIPRIKEKAIDKVNGI